MERKSLFGEFLRDWLKENIKYLGDYVEPSDQDYIARLRARELTELAKEKGYYADLVEELRGQPVLKFIISEYWRVGLEQKVLHSNSINSSTSKTVR
ncbi:hypothetical protein ATO67_06775 [Agrobacterium bohemicum]|uniref:DUF768 domain-containing protein n=1 Tax=Agrobacterium bohemicum TaxID=2052828 RepID=A0A135P2S8_9HYPH|nr:hypothetical protein ATO67_06775 [Agrobacterium bohemicum]